MTSSWPPGRAVAGVAHSLVNAVAIAALSAMHLWGSLSAEWAALGILACAGLWLRATRAGPPPGPPGAAGALALLWSRWG